MVGEHWALRIVVVPELLYPGTPREKGAPLWGDGVSECLTLPAGVHEDCPAARGPAPAGPLPALLC